MRTAAAYIRVSTEDQIEYSPDSQRKLILRYAAQHGWQVPDAFIFIDEGISGRKAEKKAGIYANDYHGKTKAQTIFCDSGLFLFPGLPVTGKTVSYIKECCVKIWELN